MARKRCPNLLCDVPLTVTEINRNKCGSCGFPIGEVFAESDENTPGEDWIRGCGDSNDKGPDHARHAIRARVQNF